MQITREAMLGKVLDFLMRVGVEYNLHQDKYWGVLFLKKGERYSAIVASAYYWVEVENLDITPPGEFFSYYSNEWTSCKYPLELNQMIEQLQSITYAGKIVVPFPNIINLLNKITDTDKEKTRVIFSPGKLEKGDILMRFTKNQAGALEYRHQALPKPCIVADNSVIPSHLIKEKALYKCRIVGENEDVYFATCIEEFGKVRIGLHYSPAGFIPDDMDSINALRTVVPDKILCVNVVEPSTMVIPPIHMHGILFYDLVKLCALGDDKLLEVHIGDNPNSPVMIRNLRENPDHAQVNIVATTLNPFFGPQRR